MDFDIISLGNSCTAALAMRELNIKTETYPFDWVRSNPKIIYDVLVNGPKKYLTFGDPDHLDSFEMLGMYRYFITKNLCPNVTSSYINYYGQHFTHYINIHKDDLLDKFLRYFDRFFKKISTSKSILFIHTTENYIAHELSMNKRFVYYLYLNKIVDYIRKIYPSLDFKIINIEYKNSNSDSKFITNIDMDYNTGCLFEYENVRPDFFNPYRKEVTKVLREIISQIHKNN